MNDDRCYHVPTAPGQSVCTCLDRRMFLEFLVALQAQRIVELHADKKVGPITYLQGPCPACAAGHVLHEVNS